MIESIVVSFFRNPFSNIAQIAEVDNLRLHHFVFLPDLNEQEWMVNLSAKLNRSYRKSFYQLEAHPPACRRLVEGSKSLPHMTVMHFWAEDEVAKELFVAFAKAAEQTNLYIPSTVKIAGLSLFSNLPRFLGGSCQSDSVAWLSVDRTPQLVALQKLFYDIVTLYGAEPVTKLAGEWRPHFTLMVEPSKDPDTLPWAAISKARIPSIETVTGGFYMGVSGPNGQFRGVISQLNAVISKAGLQ